MKNQIKFILSFVTLATLSFSGNVMASETLKQDSLSFETSKPTYLAQMGQRGKRKGERGDFMEKLNLTTEQQQKMQSIRTKYQPQMDSIRQEMRTERETLRQMMTNNNSSDSLRSQHNKIASLNQRMADLRFQSMLEMREVLTSEQRQQWNQMMEEKKANWQEKKPKN
ncbi:Spy/CpxP family protein refolding chaperone [Geminocystis herdmanii]|uniref:Spy/CpxP family protein refolding chaperone n=1 Tax=Geminocystis herdmanii TaxID=669359 RepID=UPI000347389F|nr:Spy/CpxP family protein refolding chaperone [Geminocystis herdmanii]